MVDGIAANIFLPNSSNVFGTFTVLLQIAARYKLSSYRVVLNLLLQMIKHILQAPPSLSFVFHRLHGQEKEELDIMATLKLHQY